VRRYSIAAVLAAALVSCAGSSSEIAMTDDLRFEPETITVENGTTVTFVNDSEQPHTATAYEDEVPGNGFFSSSGSDSEVEAREDIARGLIPPGETFEVTLDAPGTYRYFCIPHEDQGMKGTIEVE
jgi:plastocyanin